VAKTIKGFGVRGQERRKLRSELKGTYEGRIWIIRYEHEELFRWHIGKMSGYSGPTVGDVLRVMRRASKAQTELQDIYQEQSVPAEVFNSLRLLYRWEQRLLKGFVNLTGPHGIGEKRHYRVTEK